MASQLGTLSKAIVGGKEVMLWTYGEFVSYPKWQNPDAKAQLTATVYANWDSTARAAGYTPVNGTATETIVPKWQRSDSVLTDISDAGDPDAISFVVSGQVT